eukprot:Nk52_evm15s236 gene=Nk52_evmTU15s236
MGEGEVVPKKKSARNRWKILADAIKGNKNVLKSDVGKSSVRRFTSFEVFQVTKSEDLDFDCFVEESLKGNLEWYCHELSAENINVIVGVFRASFQDIKELMGFNNTGNVCIWPSEEILAFFLVKNRKSFEGSSVLELGAGMSGLAGLALAKSCKLNAMVITDGNESSTNVLDANIRANEVVCASSKVLVWDKNEKYADLREQFDYIICADCLFFTEFHTDLLHVMRICLKPNGKVYIFAPKRGDTLNQFVNLARSSGATVIIDERYDSSIFHKHTCLSKKGDGIYDPNIHYPIQLCISFNASPPMNATRSMTHTT